MYLNIQELRDFYSVTKIGRKFNGDLLKEIGGFLRKNSSKDVMVFGYVNDLKKEHGVEINSCLFNNEDVSYKKGAYSIGKGIENKLFTTIEDKYYDTIVVVNAMEFADDIDSFLSSVFAKLKDDGHALVIAMSYKSLFNKAPFHRCHTFSKHAIERSLVDHGVQVDHFSYTCYPHFKNHIVDRILGGFLKFYGAFMVLECHKRKEAPVGQENLELDYKEA